MSKRMSLVEGLQRDKHVLDPAIEKSFLKHGKVEQPDDGAHNMIDLAEDDIIDEPQVLKAAWTVLQPGDIWVRKIPVLTRKDFMGNHEWCFYCWKEGAAHKFFRAQNVPDVWPVKKLHSSKMVHLTEKPTELAARAINIRRNPARTCSTCSVAPVPH